MMRNDPPCPYCGNTMMLRAVDNRPKVPPNNPQYWECAKDWQFVAYYTCAPCSQRTGTTIKAPQAHSSSMEEAMNSAYAEAMARPRRKPLTLRQLRTLIDDEQEAVVYIETNSHTETYANIIYERHIFDRYGETEGADVLRFETYGKTWRAWASRPTDEERAAAPWEG